MGLFRALLAAGLALSAGSAIAQTVTTYSNTTTGTINGSTTCSSPLVRNFTVGTSFIVADVDLGLLATHSWRGDIRLTLQSPAGTRVQIVNGNSNDVSGDNFNVRLSDEGTGLVNTDGNTVNHTTTAPPYQNTFTPNAALSAFDGQNAQGTWRLEICDIYPSADNGTFQRADLYLTALPANYADLSLAKSVSNASPAAGSTITYTLTLNNAAASNQTATNVTVRDALPFGVTFVSASGYGSYSSITGLWTVPSIAPNQTRTLTITATVSASAGATVINSAEVQSSNRTDPDSTPGNGSTTEDDDAEASFTVSGTPTPGTPPAFTCPAGNVLFDWDSVTWAEGSLNNSYTLANVGTIGFAISAPPGIWLNDGNFGGQTPAEASYYNAGLYPGQDALHYLIDAGTQADQATTTISLQYGAAGARFIVSDIDDGGAQFKDRLVVTGSYQGNPVVPILTNNVANAVAGNVAIGTAAAGNTVQDGNVIVTFLSPVDTITVVYGPDASGPAFPGQQGIGIHDITFCNPLADIDVTKTSIVYDSGASEEFHIPGNDVLYTINVSNTASGTVTANSLFVVDSLPADVTFFNGDANGGAPGTAPVIFANSGSGLTFSLATDLRYSSAATPPASFAACSYTPAAGYDPNVRHICINPKGTMTGKTGPTTPSFSLSFRARIQ
ncbi:proprotein convertase P-domain-containing protein [uncultured Parasphingopyxis sp.]|uniref:proprotein convertase P-domain-containing protein n=1 Tax=uncultured Parasphingopyxis sp. TaxID=1547918 RepID=UPI00261D8C98|nr:proprotein convertase P-domain-containing protein [uncultured Parasphingopyxis sp.]